MAVSRPAAAHANRPESWSTNHRQVHVVTLVGDLIDIDRGNPANRSVEKSISAHTRDKIAPTVRRNPHQLGDRTAGHALSGELISRPCRETAQSAATAVTSIDTAHEPSRWGTIAPTPRS